MAKARKDLADQKKMLKEKEAEQRESRRKMAESKKHKAGNADKNVIDLASSHTLEELEKMLEEAKQTEGGGGDDNMADDSSQSDEVDGSDDDI